MSTKTYTIYYQRVKTQLNVRMKAVRNDNAKELFKQADICTKKYGMVCTSSVKRTPEQNGVAERMVRTISERMRCLLNHFQLPEEMWGEATVTATYCVNIMPNSARDMEVPYAVWYRELPVYSRLRTFCCAVLAYVDKVERRKMQAKAREAIFVGYSREKHGYRLLDSKTRKAFYSHTAIFYERKVGRIATGTTPVLDTVVPIERYLEMDNVAMENIPAMLDEMHDDDIEDVDCESAGTSDILPDLPGGADDRSARTGGDSGAVAGGGGASGAVAGGAARAGAKRNRHDPSTNRARRKH
ncbi:hypothetical protein ON010_g7484 [Phytophthora cinnamomi]|nr:hypothetical protein ON010_g7484 [Phytophthora cinnamomi]